MDKEKVFIKPEADIIDFSSDDVILTSLLGAMSIDELEEY